VTGFGILFKKEWRWQLRTWRLLAVGAVFVIAGASAPLLLHFLPDLIQATGEEMVVQMPDFQAADAVKAFLDNLGQFGLIAIILAAMGAVSAERSSGTAEMVLSKPVGFGAFIVAKFASLAVTLLVGLIAGAAGAYFYALVLFGAPDVGAFIAGTALMGGYLAVVLAPTLLASSLTRSQLLAGVLALVVVIVLGVLGAIPGARSVLPSGLTAWANTLVAGHGEAHWGALAVAAAIIGASLAGAARLLRTREL
jgi:ABC-2 type transport system permease protein